MLYPKVSEMILNFVQKDEKNHRMLRNNLRQFKNIFQYVYSCVYPDVYCSTERRGFHLKSTFQLVFKTYKDKKKLSRLENPQYYQTERCESFEYKQKPIKIDGFNNEEDKLIKERVEKRKRKRQEVVEKNKSLKRHKKAEKEKIEKAELWKQLKTVNTEFKKINDAKKRLKKYQKLC